MLSAVAFKIKSLRSEAEVFSNNMATKQKSATISEVEN